MRSFQTSLAALSGFAAVILVVPANVPQAAACAGSENLCSCEGDADAKVTRGGDSTPLTWSSQPYLVRKGTSHCPPVFCFDQSVENHLDKDVYKIDWRIARFHRKKIAAGCLRSNCFSVIGFRSAFPKDGLLYHGPSNNPYQTQVYKPDAELGSFPSTCSVTGQHETTSADAASKASDGAERPEPAVLTSHVHVDVEGEEGGFELSDVIITSVVSDEEEDTVLYYYFYNDGENRVKVYPNMSKTASFAENFIYTLESPIELESFEEEKIAFSVDEDIVIESAPVLIWDEKGDLAAIGTVGLYTVEDGVREISNDELWMMTENQ